MTGLHSLPVWNCGLTSECGVRVKTYGSIMADGTGVIRSSIHNQCSSGKLDAQQTPSQHHRKFIIFCGLAWHCLHCEVLMRRLRALYLRPLRPPCRKAQSATHQAFLRYAFKEYPPTKPQAKRSSTRVVSIAHKVHLYIAIEELSDILNEGTTSWLFVSSLSVYVRRTASLCLSAAPRATHATRLSDALKAELYGASLSTRKGLITDHPSVPMAKGCITSPTAAAL